MGFEVFVVATGNPTDDFRGGDIADFGVKGLVAVWTGSGPDFPDDDRFGELCAGATQIPVKKITNKLTILRFIRGLRVRTIRVVPFIRARFQPTGAA